MLGNAILKCVLVPNLYSFPSCDFIAFKLKQKQ